MNAQSVRRSEGGPDGERTVREKPGPAPVKALLPNGKAVGARFFRVILDICLCCIYNDTVPH